MMWFKGPGRITVIAVDAAWSQRAVVRPDGDGDGEPVVIPGVVGSTAQVGAGGFRLTLEHDPGGGWRPNVRMVQASRTRRGRSDIQVIRSKDRDWDGDRDENDLVVRLETFPDAPWAEEYPEETPAPQRHGSPAGGTASSGVPAGAGRISTVSTGSGGTGRGGHSRSEDEAGSGRAGAAARIPSGGTRARRR
ncbi:hypothetical protein ACWCXB_25480 [Streptomyces sp. NPDC001514]